MTALRDLLRSMFAGECSRRLMAFSTGDDAPLRRTHSYKRPFAKKFVRWFTAADSPNWNRVVMIAKERLIVQQLKPDWWLHSLRNEPVCLIMVWALARKS